MCILLENEKKLFNYLTLSPRKAEIPACRSLIYSHKAKISAENFEKTVTNNVVSGSSGSGDPCCGSSGVGGLIEK